MFTDAFQILDEVKGYLNKSDRTANENLKVIFEILSGVYPEGRDCNQESKRCEHFNMQYISLNRLELLEQSAARYSLQLCYSSAPVLQLESFVEGQEAIRFKSLFVMGRAKNEWSLTSR